jgi:hypothetical protein
MAGYSGTPLPRKLGIVEGHRVAALDPPPGFERTLGALPAGAALQVGLRGKSALDVAIVFVTRRAELERRLGVVRARMTQAGGIWIAWPKKASGVATDVTEDVIRAVALPTGLVDNKVCAIDETWSGLRLVVRRELRR